MEHLYFCRKPRSQACRLLACLAALLLFLPYTLPAQESYYQQAIALAQAQAHEEAAVLLNELVRDYPTYLPAQIMRAHNLAWWGRYVQAIEAYQELLALYPQNMEIQEGLAYARIWAGDWPGGLAIFRELLRQDPNNDAALK
ncbi:MAG: tetratricopeptide repeat protein, partial [Bacteroidetes bacterium]